MLKRIKEQRVHSNEISKLFKIVSKQFLIYKTKQKKATKLKAELRIPLKLRNIHQRRCILRTQLNIQDGKTSAQTAIDL